MRNLLAALILGLPFAGGPFRISAEEPPRALIERAIKACGGTVTDQPMALWTKYRIKPAADVSFLLETWGQTTGTRSRIDLFDEKTQHTFGSMVFNERVIWRRAEGEAEELKDDNLTTYTHMQHMERVIWLLPLLQDKKFTLSSLGESPFEGRKLQGVRVQYPGRQEVCLYFDKETGLLTRAKSSWGKDLPIVQVFRAYRPVDWCAKDEKVLRQAGIATDGPSLLAYLRRRLPDAVQEAQIGKRVRQLGERSYARREEASRSLQSLGRIAEAAVRRAAHSPDAEVARRARRLLEDLGPDSAVPLRRAAIHLLGRRRPAGAAEVLLAYLPHAADPAEQREVESALVAVAQRNGKPEPCLIEALKGPEPLRRAAAAALGRDAGASARQPGRRLYLPHLKVAHEVVYYLGGEKQDSALELLELQLFNQHEDRLFARP